MDAQLDFRGRQDGVILAETQGAFAHIKQRVTRARARRIKENRALTDGRLGRTRDEVASQGEVARRNGTSIVDGRKEVTTRGYARVKGDTAGDRGDIRIANEHHDTRAIEATGGKAVDDNVVGHRDAVAELEARAAVGVGAWLSGERNGTAREAERIGDLHVALINGEGAIDLVVDQGGQDEAAITSLR